MRHYVTLIPGDGIGHEISEATVRVLNASGVDIIWEEQKAGAEVLEQCGSPLPEYVINSVRKNRVALKGPITTPIGTGFRSVNVGLRKALTLYANLRPIKTMPNVPCRYEDIDLVVVRENMEDLYAGIEHMVGEDAAESIKIITRKGSERIVRFAFEYARKEGRKKVTAVHKANILKLSDGLFLEVARSVAKEYPDIKFDDKIVDNACMQLVQNPWQFDVMVMPNLYGDILSDLCAGLVGGLGVAPAANHGEDAVIFEPIHGSAPDIAGQDKANPIAMILSGALMLDYLNEKEAAEKVRNAVLSVLFEGKCLTSDLGGKASTKEITEAIIEKIKA